MIDSRTNLPELRSMRKISDVSGCKKCTVILLILLWNRYILFSPILELSEPVSAFLRDWSP